MSASPRRTFLGLLFLLFHREVTVSMIEMDGGVIELVAVDRYRKNCVCGSDGGDQVSFPSVPWFRFWLGLARLGL